MPVEVTWLPKGAFENHINLRRSQGADLAHLKPRHIAPSDHELSMLTSTAAKTVKEEKISVGAPAAS
jgi:hypothetical protein